VVVTVPIGQEYAAQALLAQLTERGIQVELQHAQNPLTRRRAAMNKPVSATMGQQQLQVKDTCSPLQWCGIYN
jgi:hypothetical protein